MIGYPNHECRQDRSFFFELGRISSSQILDPRTLVALEASFYGSCCIALLETMGRKSKAKNESKPKKVSETNVDVVEQPEEVWDLERVIPKGEGIICRTEGCKDLAVATWCSNLESDDKWPLCEGCQLKDFGGWPEGVDPPDDEEEEEEQDPTEAKESHDRQNDAETSSSSSNQETASSSSPTSSNKIESDEKPKDKNDLSSGTPSTTSVDSSPPVDKNDTPEPSKEPRDTSQVSSEESTNGSSEGTPEMAPVVSQSTDQDAEEEENEIWDLKKILPYADITKEATIKCSTETCKLPACCIWKSNLAPNTNVRRLR